MDLLNQLEKWLAGIYKTTPKLSPSAKKSITGMWPIVALVFGLLQLLAVVELWHWGHRINQAANVLGSLGQYYGAAGLAVVHLNVFYWLSLIVLAIDGILLLLAYPGLKDHKKAGWNLLFYASILNLVYGVFSALNNYGGVSSLILQIIVSAIVLYFLFQIRDQYGAGARPKAE